MNKAFIGIDVGTGSARAGVFDAKGELLSAGKHDIKLHIAANGVAEHESNDIWTAICAATRQAVAGAGDVQFMGIGVDAACSLVVEGQQLSSEGCQEQDVMVWMDHRAIAEAEEINATGHRVLNFVGGSISPEMQTPKLLWLSRHRREVFERAPHFMDLADWITFKLTSHDARSTCTTTCKWTYLPHDGGWDEDYFRKIGLGALADEEFKRIGTDIRKPGSPIGPLTKVAAAQLGLPQHIQVSSGLIDAHAGGVGTIGVDEHGGFPSGRMAYVFGTSACTMSSHPHPLTIPGIWGPYYDAMLPGLWLNEGGQSAAGAALDHLVKLHPAYADVAARKGDVLAHLTDVAMAMGDSASLINRTRHLTVVPDFNGNRAPLANPHAKAIIAGLDLSQSEDSLVDLFVAGLVGVSCGLRHIIDIQAEMGLPTQDIAISGGAGANPLARQILADVTGCEIMIPITTEPVLLGSAMLASVAAGEYQDLQTAMSNMSRHQKSVQPTQQAKQDIAVIFERFKTLQNAASPSSS